MAIHDTQTKPVFAYCPNCWTRTYHVDEPGGRRCLNCKALRDMKTIYPVTPKREATDQIPQSH
jgi:hypothetical protein